MRLARAMSSATRRPPLRPISRKCSFEYRSLTALPALGADLLEELGAVARAGRLPALAPGLADAHVALVGWRSARHPAGQASGASCCCIVWGLRAAANRPGSRSKLRTGELEWRAVHPLLRNVVIGIVGLIIAAGLTALALLGRDADLSVLALLAAGHPRPP